MARACKHSWDPWKPKLWRTVKQKAEFAHFLCNLGLFCLHFTHCKPLAILASRCDLWPFWVWLSDSITFPVMETSPPLVEKATVCLLLVLMMILHIAFSQAGLKGSLLPLWEWRNSGRERERTQRQIEQDLRFEMEIMKTRMQNFSKVSGYFSKSFFFRLTWRCDLWNSIIPPAVFPRLPFGGNFFCQFVCP